MIGGDEEASAQTIRFQPATDAGPDPFTPASDTRGKSSVRLEIGEGPFGGTGSNLVCDRELLIRSLLARPDRLQEFARVVNVDPTAAAVSAYVRSLTPVTLTRDTRVTNHSFADGRAVGFQAILQAGTAVLVDAQGIPRVRCRCGNPLREEILIEKAKCLGCPANYEPPPPCRPFRECYKAYPDPPPVKGGRRPTPQPSTTPSTASESPAANFSPSEGRQGDRFKLFVSGFRPNTTLNVSLTRPDGVVEPYTITTRGSGGGEVLFNPTGENDVTGTYVAVVTNRSTGASARASAQLLPRAGSTPQPSSPTPRPAPPRPAPGGEASDLPQCGAGIPRPCLQDGRVVE